MPRRPLCFAAQRVSRNASRVLFEPVPGITLIRPAAISTTAAMTRSCSSCDSGRRFAGGADRAEALRPGGDLKFDLRPQHGQVHLAVLERSRNRDRHTGKRFAFS